jgi:hypothetical protein
VDSKTNLTDGYFNGGTDIDPLMAITGFSLASKTGNFECKKTGRHRLGFCFALPIIHSHA